MESALLCKAWVMLASMPQHFYRLKTAAKMLPLLSVMALSSERRGLDVAAVKEWINATGGR
jgi:hypothetical protein